MDDMTMITRLESLDKLQRTDHDTLIRVESKLDQMLSDTKQARDEGNTRWGDHEARLKIIEGVVHDAQRDIKVGRYVAGAVWGAAGGILLFLLQIAGHYFHII